MSQLQAAALLPQLDELDRLNRERGDMVQCLTKQFENRYQWLTLAPIDQAALNAFYKFGFLVQEQLRELVIAQLTSQGIECGPGFHGFHRRGEGRCRKIGDLSHARRLANESVLLQHHHLLESDLIDRLTDAFDLCDKVRHENTAYQ
jgi:dTDP-4-amino-4,6-dideoxygalactose transaminase